ncbi:hypothetical protein M8C21_012270, partial [Ambrosia artemisiifolia]
VVEHGLDLLYRSHQQTGELRSLGGNIFSVSLDDSQYFQWNNSNVSNLDRKLIERLLKTFSYHVTAVDSGSKALEFLGLDEDESDDVMEGKELELLPEKENSDTEVVGGVGDEVSGMEEEQAEFMKELQSFHKEWFSKSDNEIYGIRDNRTIGDNNSDNEEEYDSEMDSRNVKGSYCMIAPLFF